jgi:hypothetical protein
VGMKKDIKYSIIMPYYDRPEIKFTLDSFAHYYSYRKDIEVVIVEDSKNFSLESLHKNLMEYIGIYQDKMNLLHVVDPKESFCPPSKYNIGVKMSSGTIIMLTNPETPHNFDLFEQLDKEDFSNKYIVCGCVSVKLIKDRGDYFRSDFEFFQWYQHSKHRNVRYHFCSVLSKDNYNKIDGFDERYCKGFSFDDDNFLKRVEKGLLDIEVRDDLFVSHIEHDRRYNISSDEIERLKDINRKLWISQLEANQF